MWRTAEKRFVGHVCLRNLFLPFLFGIQSIHPLPEATASCPSLHCSSKKKPVPCTETEGLVIELWSPRFLTMQWLCSWLCFVTAANQWFICGDWAFSNSDLDVRLPAFQLPMFAKCDALPKGDLLDMFVKGILSRYSFREFQASTPYQKLDVLETGGTLL